MTLAGAAREAALLRFNRNLSDYSADEFRRLLATVPEGLASLVAGSPVLASVVTGYFWTREQMGDPSAIIRAVEGDEDDESADDADDDEDVHNRQPLVGEVTALWAGQGADPNDGGVRIVEAGVLDGQGPPQVGGDIGEVLRMSVAASWAHVRLRHADYGITDEALRDKQLHLHLVEIAESIEGPSAGIPFVVVIVSALLDRAVIPALAMTGEVSLKGTVSPVGGIVQKLTAAYRAGRRTVIMPRGNERDLDRVPKLIRDALDIRLVSTAQEAVRIALATE